jgi:hyperosmotically inducible protein
MRSTKALGSVFSILLAIGAPAAGALVIQGCNTVQSPREQVNDVQITTQIKSKLASDVNASSLANIDVNTTNGVVTLAGEVESPEVKHRAQTVAEAVPGVTRVNNNLQVATASASEPH